LKSKADSRESKQKQNNRKTEVRLQSNYLRSIERRKDKEIEIKKKKQSDADSEHDEKKKKSEA